MLGYLKAFVAGVTAFGVPFGGAFLESSDQGVTVTSGEWLTALIAGVVAGVAVWRTSNNLGKSTPTSPA